VGGVLARATFLLSGLALLSLGSSVAHAQRPNVMHEITWAHASPADVRAFVVYLAPNKGKKAESKARIIDVGKPKSVGSGGGGVRYYSAVIQGNVGEFVAVAAIAADGTRSPLSAWAGLPPSRPGQPLLVTP
jgi:hypothetical protein